MVDAMLEMKKEGTGRDLDGIEEGAGISHANPETVGQPKTRVASFRLSLEAHAKMTDMAEAAGISARAWLEQAVLDNRTRILARTKPHPELKPLLFQAAKAGNNLNQLAHRFNALRLEGRLTGEECNAAMKTLEAIRELFAESIAHARSY